MMHRMIALSVCLVMVALPHAVAAHPGPPTNQPASARPLIWRGSRGPAVADLQRLLNDWIRQARGAVRPLEVDGIFGARTDAAVRAYQYVMGLPVDGVVGPKTWAALLGPAPAPPATARTTAGAPGSSAARLINTGGRDLYNCVDFATWAAANAVYRANLPGDPNQLDEDSDGIPCEDLPGAP